MNVNIPFNKWSKERLNTNGKCCTSRTRQYGIDGDVFVVEGVIYEMVTYQLFPLWFVKEFLWKLEGANSPEEFEQVWNEIHPIKKFDPNQIVGVHFFRVHK